MIPHPIAAARIITTRKVTPGSSQNHSHSPAMIAESTMRSHTPSRRAPPAEARSWRRAVSPSTPSSTDTACVRIPPTTARPAESDHAAQNPMTAVNSVIRFGARRSGDSHIVIRVDTGRLI